MTTKKVKLSGMSVESQLLNKALKSKKIPGSNPNEIGKNYKLIKKKVGSNSDIMDKINKIYKDTLQEYLDEEPTKPKEKTGFKDLPRELQLKIFSKTDMVDRYPEITSMFELIYDLYESCNIVFDSYAEKVYEDNKGDYEDYYEAKENITEYGMFSIDIDELSTFVLVNENVVLKIRAFKKELSKKTNLNDNRINEIISIIAQNVEQNQRLVVELFQSAGEKVFENTNEINKMVGSLEPPNDVFFYATKNYIKRFVSTAMNELPKKVNRKNVLKFYAIIASSFAINYLLNSDNWENGEIMSRFYLMENEKTWKYIVNEALSKIE